MTAPDPQAQAQLAVRLADEFGFYVFPVDHPTATSRCTGIKTREHNPDTCTERGKHPCCKWSEWSTNDAGLLFKSHYFGGRHAKNIGIDCGKSGLLVLDEDQLDELARFCSDHGIALPPTLVVRTASGFHWYFRQPTGEQLGNREGLLRHYKINVRGAGGYVVGPGSLHASGLLYAAANSVRAIASTPAMLVEALKALEAAATGNSGAGGDAWWRVADPIPAGERHNAVVAAAGWCRRMGLKRNEAIPTIRDVFARLDLSDGKYTWEQCLGKLDDVYARYEAGYRFDVGGFPPGQAGSEGGKGDGVPPRAEASPVLPPAFWEARAVLAHIRQAAHSRQRSADAVFHAVLARVAAISPHGSLLPAIVGSTKPVCYFVAVVALPGVGKGDANAIATELLPAPGYVADQLPIGSGEGLAELLFDTVEELDEKGKARQVKRQTRNNAYVYIDEGEVLGALSNRNGSTLKPTLRSIWSGNVLGQANANRERFRVVLRNSYVFGLVAGFQPARAGELLDDADGGTPQRFAWALATDPNIPQPPPEWPGALNWTPPPGFIGGHEYDVDKIIWAEIQSLDLVRARGGGTSDPLDAQAELFRLKVAALLAILDGRRDVSLEDWRLAGMVQVASNAVRDTVVQAVAEQARQREAEVSARQARRHVHARSSEETWRTVECAKRIRDKVAKHPGLTSTGLRRSLSGPQRDVLVDAIDHALGKGWIEERAEPGQGGDKRAFYPGAGGGR